jgi:transcription initiation factor TFIID TATA-box-binding protein
MSTPVGIEGSEYRDLQVVNIVASGTLGAGEIDVKTLATDLDVVKTVQPGRLYLSKSPGTPVAMVFRSGSYTIAGAESWQEVIDTVEWLSQVLNSVGVDIDREMISVSVVLKYLVATAELGSNVNLAAAAVALGLERTEYEPEQFPALIYRPDDSSWTVMLFSNGKVTITGGRDVKTAHHIFHDIQATLIEETGT